MTLWIDADSCPAEVRKAAVQKARDMNVPAVFAANRDIKPPFEYPLFTMHVCPAQEGAADSYIEQNASRGDIVITRDIPLAGRLIQKEVTVINDRGHRFTGESIKTMLEERELHMQMVALGVAPKGNWKSFGKKELDGFISCLNSLFEASGYSS